MTTCNYIYVSYMHLTAVLELVVTFLNYAHLNHLKFCIHMVEGHSLFGNTCSNFKCVFLTSPAFNLTININSKPPSRFQCTLAICPFYKSLLVIYPCIKAEFFFFFYFQSTAAFSHICCYSH